MNERVWLVIPTYNEADNLERVVTAACQQLDRVVPGDYRVLVVDDNSPDGTGAIADRLADAHDVVDVLHRASKDGLGRAYVAGFERALTGGAELLIEMDADFSHNPRYLADLLAAAEGGADLVIGSRYVTGGGVKDWGLLRRLVSRGGSLYARLLLGVEVRDLTGGFKCIHRGVLEAIDLPTIQGEGYVFQIEVTYRAILGGFSVREVPILFTDRTTGTSKMSWRIAVEAMRVVPSLRRASHHPLAEGTRATAGKNA